MCGDFSIDVYGAEKSQHFSFQTLICQKATTNIHKPHPNPQSPEKRDRQMQLHRSPPGPSPTGPQRRPKWRWHGGRCTAPCKEAGTEAKGFSRTWTKGVVFMDIPRHL